MIPSFNKSSSRKPSSSVSSSFFIIAISVSAERTCSFSCSSDESVTPPSSCSRDLFENISFNNSNSSSFCTICIFDFSTASRRPSAASVSSRSFTRASSSDAFAESSAFIHCSLCSSSCTLRSCASFCPFVTVSPSFTKNAVTVPLTVHVTSVFVLYEMEPKLFSTSSSALFSARTALTSTGKSSPSFFPPEGAHAQKRAASSTTHEYFINGIIKNIFANLRTEYTAIFRCRGEPPVPPFPQRCGLSFLPRAPSIRRGNRSASSRLFRLVRR